MSCLDPWFTYFYRRRITRRKNRTDKYNQLSRRYKRRNRYQRYGCKKHRDFCTLMNSFADSTVLDNLRVTEIKHRLQPFLAWLKRYYELNCLAVEPDYRSGFETYGYNTDEDSDEETIKGQLSYISDRWNCSFRVRWLINLVDPDYTITKKVSIC